MQFEKPILLVTFNRPDTTKKVLEAIANVQPKKLYVFSDAPREGNENDTVMVGAVRNLFMNLNWEVELHTKFENRNLGCAKGVSSAISWIFETEKQAIILEDDCLPNNAFFDFCSQMLDRYENSDQVMHISGSRWNEEFKTGDSYLFSSIGHIWGWATWKRAWDKYDYNMADWGKHIPKIKIALQKPLYVGFWKELFQEVAVSNKKHTWDYQWQYTLFKEKGLAVVPDVNMILNIGPDGVHSNSSKQQRSVAEYTYDRKLNNWKLYKHPVTVIQNKMYDDYHMDHHFFRFYSPFRRFKKLVKYYVKGR